MARSIEESRRAALAYIDRRNVNGAYDPLLYALAEGRLDVGLLEYDGQSLDDIDKQIAEIERKLAAPPAERLDYRTETLQAERRRLAEFRLVAQHFIANPVLYTVRT